MSMSFKPLGLAIALALAGCNQAAPPADTAAPDAMATTPAATEAAAPAAEAPVVAAPQLQAAMRDLWHGHVVHTREYAIAMHAGDKAAAKTAADAVVANAMQIADAVGGFYGKAGGDQMMTLLAGHWGAVKALTDTRMSGDEAGAGA